MWLPASSAMYLITRIDYHTLMGQVPVFYVLAIVLLLVTFAIGTEVFGSKRWIPLAGGFHFQVSEFFKLVIVLLVARYLSELKGEQPRSCGSVETRSLSRHSDGPGGQPAGFGNGPNVRPDPGGWSLFRWFALAACASWPGCLGGSAAAVGLVFRPEGLPEGSDRDLSRSREGPARQGLSGHPVQDCGRCRWNVGEGGHARIPNPVTLPAGAAHGLYYLGLRRGAWVCRRGCRVGPVLSAADADRAERADGSGPGRDV